MSTNKMFFYWLMNDSKHKYLGLVHLSSGEIYAKNDSSFPGFISSENWEQSKQLSPQDHWQPALYVYREHSVVCLYFLLQHCSVCLRLFWVWQCFYYCIIIYYHLLYSILWFSDLEWLHFKHHKHQDNIRNVLYSIFTYTWLNFTHM